MSTPFELVFVKSLRARSKASLMQTTDLLAQGLTNPILRLVQKYTRQFPCSPLMLGKRKRHQSFCQNHTTIYHFPKSLKTDGISASSTNYYHDERHSRLQGKSTVAGTKAVAEAGFFSNMHHALWLDTMDKVLKQTVEKP